MLRCTGCGSTQTIAEIREQHPGALSCCPERHMQWFDDGELQKRPVAFRVKDYGDGWIIFQDEKQAYLYAEKTGALMQGLYVRDGT